MTTKRIILEIKSEHIRNGRKKDPDSCAVALALNDRFGIDLNRGVTRSDVHWLVKGSEHVIPHFGPARELIRQFDRNKSQCKPCRSVFDVPEEYVK